MSVQLTFVGQTLRQGPLSPSSRAHNNYTLLFYTSASKSGAAANHSNIVMSKANARIFFAALHVSLLRA